LLKTVTNKILSTWPKLLLATIINIAIWEIFFRLFISSPCTQIFDNELGYINQPRLEYLETMEGYSRTRFNSLGFNDEEPMQKNEGTRNIFIVGDSYTEAFQVAKGKCYTQIAEDLVNLKPPLNKNIDIIKIARDGFIPIHYPIVINRFIERFNPEFIILQFASHSGGDLYSKDLEAAYSIKGELTSLNLETRMEDKYKNIFRNFLNNSSLFYYFIRKYNSFIMNYVNKLIIVKNEKTQIKDFSIKKPVTVEDMSARFTFLIKQIMQFKVKVVILYLPGPGEYFDDKNEKHHETLEALRLTTERLSIPLLDTTEDFNRFYKEKAIPLNGFINSLPGKGHLNIYGHKIVGEKIAGYLKDAILGEHKN
jgi:hypothetical protein